MADTLRSLAGTAFRTSDVISARHAPLTPEERVLDRYVFLPHARTGIAAALTTPFAWTLPARASVNVRVPVIDDRGAIDAEMTVHVYGPGDVTEIDVRQVIRTFPKADAVNAEVDDLVHIEFDRPDLPWLFTPAGANAQGHLVPWITLVVAERRFVEWGAWRDKVREAHIRRDQLQPLDDAWAWAHAQVMGAKGAAAATEPTLERRLSESNAAHNLSRLVCPRRLDDHTAYVACVVPTFLAGVQAALGLTRTTTLLPAWGTAEDFRGGDPLDRVTLPVYFSWEFGTGEEGNFESLAHKLRPAVAPPGVGRRRVDATRPWPGVALAADDPGAEIVVNGPVVSPQQPESEPEAAWPPETAQRWDPAVSAMLVEKLNRADEQAHAADPGPPVVTPPLYGGLHARQHRFETGAAEAAAQPEWFRDLNGDPRHRIVGGLGTRVVQAEQEDLMLAAWNQVMGVEAANRALRMAQMAKHVTASLHRRHLATLTDAAVMNVTERVHAKVRETTDQSVWATIDASSLPVSVTLGAFRRLARVRGPIVRAVTMEPAARREAVDRLAVAADRLTTDWVHAYRMPDGIRSLSAVASESVTDRVAARIDPRMTREDLLRAWRRGLRRPMPSDELTPEAIGQAPLVDVMTLAPALVSGLTRQLLRTAPSEAEMAQRPDAAVAGAAHGVLLRALGESAGGANVGAFDISRDEADRLGLPIGGESDRPGFVRVSRDAVASFATRAQQFAERHQIDVPRGDIERMATRLRTITARASTIERGQLRQAMSQVANRVVTDDRFLEPTRPRISAPALQLVQKLDPSRTIPARVSARLTSGSGRMPSWLRPDWFDDLRIEPVMAHPRFKYPMFEPLHRYDREWMVPGLGLITRPDMATLLVTNNRFIEAYLVGLNHEMARELLWREYPTDQRGTYFSSFWTGEAELIADMHEAPWRHGPLGSHVDPALDGQLVFLVRGDLIRRYPGVVAHAAREADSDRGMPIFEATSPVRTLFHVHLPPNVLLVGFALTTARIATLGEKWWFTLSENPTEPRFGLDPSREGGISRDNLTWADFGVSRAGLFLDATSHTNLIFDGARWGASSAANAYLLFQLPARAAFSAARMVAGATR